MTHFCQRSDESSFFRDGSDFALVKTLWELFNLTEFKSNR